MEALKEVVEKLPPDLQQEVKDFIEFLLEKRAKKNGGKPKFDWAGALEDLRNEYTSVELQHTISKWRIGDR
jgi:hypothetical protein